jgi:acetolactate synthase-1/3 small subunit
MILKEFTISVYTENQTGLLSRVVSVFTRRHININSLNTSESSIKGIYRFTIVVHVSKEQVMKLVAQLEKQIDVLKAFYYTNDEIVYQEIALYKVPTEIFADGEIVEKLVRAHHARIISIEPAYTVIEKTGHAEETQLLLTELQKYGVYEFVRSGRVAIVKPMEQLNSYLKSIQEKNKNIIDHH